MLMQGPAFGMPGVLVDGMDVLKVREVAVEAIARARRGDGPTLIEASTYRFRGHSLADPDEMRSKEEKAKWAVSMFFFPRCVTALIQRILNTCTMFVTFSCNVAKWF